MDTNLRDKVVIITGAASGIGAASARAFAAEGAKLALVDRDEDGLKQLAAELSTEVSIAVADLSTLDGVTSGIDEALAPYDGHVDVLFNNVGAGSLGLFDTLTDTDWSRTLELNFLSQVRAATHLLPRMRAQQAGAIVNNASDLGRQPIVGGPDYAASKAAILSFTTSLAKSEGPYIRVNAVAAGATMSPMWSMPGGLADTFAAIHAVPREESITAEMKARNLPLGRIGEPHEVANVVVFLASDLASYVTSSVYGVDGGSIGSIV
ncbi:SDR family NAD(P)-dependent oxidoreductase [Rhodococcoides fascians]|uniref:SDR family NAD(P)-dependent oxidoreductase n=1 Tax=Rhodococcoides fascians TaxID=1828 RepID=UPI00055EF4FB|nr:MULTISPECIES: SDR family oxidoreductase [Rhodococcus]OZF01298.1 NAD(P)-dependent oxidoreductase [Rhodococcus sp. 15-1189-1-1a]OZF15469.1 NAD(P)-dependent oxidoreductase [Rhodococcus sp. 14-2686-1-2]